MIRLHKVDKYLQPTPYWGNTSQTKPVYDDGTFGSPGISESALDREKADVEAVNFDLNFLWLIFDNSVNDGLDPLKNYWSYTFPFDEKLISVTPKRGDIEGITYNEGYGDVELAGGVLWDGENDTALTVPTHTYFEAPYYQKDVTPYGHLVRTHAYVYNGNPGSEAKITIGSGVSSYTVNEGSVIPTETPAIHKIYDAYSSDPVTIPLTDLKTAQYTTGSTLSVYLIQYDYLCDGNGKFTAYQGDVKIFTIKNIENPLKITAQPQSFTATQALTYTFSASGGDILDAWWEEVSPHKGNIYDGDLSGDTVTLDWGGTSMITLCSCFKGRYGVVKSDPATYTEIRWQKADQVLIGSEKHYVFLDSKFMISTEHLTFNGPIAIFNNPVKSDAGRYRIACITPTALSGRARPLTSPSRTERLPNISTASRSTASAICIRAKYRRRSTTCGQTMRAMISRALHGAVCHTVRPAC